jgi:YidC/Oxa1 family membrane protein insertase
MERNSIIGLVLIAFIMIVWFEFLSPKPQPKPKVTPPVVTLKDSTPATPVIRSDSAARVAAVSTLGKFSQAATGTEQFIDVETPLYKARLSTKGATIKSFQTKKYLDFNQKPAELISNPQGSLSLLFSTKDGKVINTSSLYFQSHATSDKITVGESGTKTIPFELVLDNGKKIEIVYEISGDSYRLGYKVNLEGITEDIAGYEYQTVWTGGLLNTEKNKEDEARNACAYAYAGGELVKLDAEKVTETYRTEPGGQIAWVATKIKYFTAALIPSATDKTNGAYLSGFRTTNDAKDVFEDYTTALKMPIPPDAKSVKNSFTVYLGPLDYELVKDNGVKLEKIMDFGWEFVTRPFAEYFILPIFEFLNKFISNYGIIIIVFSLIIKLVTFPATMSSMKSMKKMSALQPQLQAMQEQYKSDPQRLQKETMKIYKEAGVNPLGGCLPQLIQLPLLYAMYNVFHASIQLRQAGFLWAKDLSLPDSILDFPFSIPLYGDHVSLYGILMGVAFFFQQKITPQTAAGSNQQMAVFNKIFPFIFVIMFNNLPAGLGLYYFMFNLFGLAQQAWNNYTTPKPTAVVVQPPTSGKKQKKLERA